MTKLVIKHDDKPGTAAIISEYKDNAFRPTGRLEEGQEARVSVEPGDAIKIEYIESSSDRGLRAKAIKDIKRDQPVIKKPAVVEPPVEEEDEFDDLDDIVNNVTVGGSLTPTGETK